MAIARSLAAAASSRRPSESSRVAWTCVHHQHSGSTASARVENASPTSARPRSLWSNATALSCTALLAVRASRSTISAGTASRSATFSTGRRYQRTSA
jgi:hypothetical protein